MGNKNSGRYPRNLEDLRQRVIQKAWNKLDYKLSIKSDNRAYDYSRDIAVKDMVGKAQVDSNIHIDKEEATLLSKYIPTNRIASEN